MASVQPSAVQLAEVVGGRLALEDVTLPRRQQGTDDIGLRREYTGLSNMIPIYKCIMMYN